MIKSWLKYLEELTSNMSDKDKLLLNNYIHDYLNESIDIEQLSILTETLDYKVRNYFQYSKDERIRKLLRD